MSQKKTLCNEDFEQTCKNVKNISNSCKIENLMSDKRLSWMCLEGDFGLFFEVHFGLGAYPDEKPIETSKKHRRPKICWLGTWNATTWCLSSPE